MAEAVGESMTRRSPEPLRCFAHQSRAAFARHMEQLALYGTTLCVNLIDKKGQQKKLGDAFQAAVERYNKPNVKCVRW